MSKVSLYFREEDRNDPRSLIEIIMARLGGSIKPLHKYSETLWRIHDWVYVLGNDKPNDRRLPWYDLKKALIANHVIFENDFASVDEKDADGSTHQTDYSPEAGLYLVTQYMEINERVNAVRNYLADAGVFVDSFRRNPDIGHSAMRAAYKMKGKDDAWIDQRIDGIVNRDKFTRALSSAVRIEMGNREYGTVTNDIYIGLWKRTKEILLAQMELPETANLRDNQSRLALLLEGIAEEYCASYLGSEKELNWFVARSIVQEVAGKVGVFANQMSNDIGYDIATGKALSEGYEMPKLDGSGKRLNDIKNPRKLVSDDN